MPSLPTLQDLKKLSPINSIVVGGQKFALASKTTAAPVNAETQTVVQQPAVEPNSKTFTQQELRSEFLGEGLVAPRSVTEINPPVDAEKGTYDEKWEEEQVAAIAESRQQQAAPAKAPVAPSIVAPREQFTLQERMDILNSSAPVRPAAQPSTTPAKPALSGIAALLNRKDPLTIFRERQAQRQQAEQEAIKKAA